MAQKRSAPGASSGGRGGGSAGAGGAKRGKFEHKSTTGGKSGSSSASTGKHSAFENHKGKGKAPVGRAAARGGNNNKPERSTAKPEQVKKRKMPLTSSVVESPEDSEAEDDDEDMMDVDGEEENDLDQDMESSQHVSGGGSGGGGDGGGGGEAGGENKRLSKAERAALHAQQPHRTTLLPSHPLLKDHLLPLWEDARKADLTKEERKAAIAKLWEATKGRVAEVSRGHKGGRVLQTLIKFGGKEERNGIGEELNGQYKAMMSSKYSKFLIGKIIRYCPSIRQSIISQISSDVPQLLFHTYACPIIADFFELYASPKEKRMLVRSFYPNEVVVFQSVAANAVQPGAKPLEVPTLEQVLEGMTEGKGRERMLDELAEKIIHVFNSTQKQALAQAIFHRLVMEYLTCVHKFLPEEAADKKMHDLLEASLESLADIAHTKDGSSVVREFLSRGTAKDRKNILRVLKPHLQKLCEDADAQMILFTALDCVDDTKMMGKTIVAELVSLMPELAMHKIGRRVLLYLLVPRSTKYFIPSTITQLVATDEAAAKTSKKNAATRRDELRVAANEGFIKLAAEHGEEMIREAGASLLLTEIMLYAAGDKTTAIDAIVGPLAQPYPHPAPVESDPDPATAHVLDLSYADRSYKTLLCGGHYSTATKSVDVVDQAMRDALAERMWKTLCSEDAGGEDNIRHVALGNAPFVLVELIEALQTNDALKAEVKRVMKAGSLVVDVEASIRKGASVLAAKIASL